MDRPGIPLDILLLVILVMPVAVALFFGSRAFREMVPLAFHCRRCDRDFQRPAHRRFPRRCPHCHRRDWSG